MLPSVIFLGTAAVVALLLTANRPVTGDEVARRLAARSLVLAVAVQGVHFLEEAATGLHVALPGLFGRPPMPFSGFVLFNLAWLGIWVASVPGLRSGRPPAFFAAWFLAIAGAMNGIVHPLLAAFTGGYFPGLISAPFAGVASGILWFRLSKATASPP